MQGKMFWDVFRWDGSKHSDAIRKVGKRKENQGLTRHGNGRKPTGRSLTGRTTWLWTGEHHWYLRPSDWDGNQACLIPGVSISCRLCRVLTARTRKNECKIKNKSSDFVLQGKNKALWIHLRWPLFDLSESSAENSTSALEAKDMLAGVVFLPVRTYLMPRWTEAQAETEGLTFRAELQLLDGDSAPALLGSSCIFGSVLILRMYFWAQFKSLGGKESIWQHYHLLWLGLWLAFCLPFLNVFFIEIKKKNPAKRK